MYTLNCGGNLLTLQKPVVMGILNLTSDSFYADSRLQRYSDFRNKAAQMVHEGAAILDLGAQSTRPGSTRISASEEISKLLPAIAYIKENFPEIFISVDTYYSEVAGICLNDGVHIINDISGGNLDPNMISTVGKAGAPYVCMHTKGSPENMQSLAQYEDVVKEVLEYFVEKTGACKSAGIMDMIIDPGFGFAKTISQNFILLKNLELFKIFDKVLMVGLSRKSSIYKTLDITAEESLNGSTVFHTIALQKGINILRVHDVKEAMEVIKLLEFF